MEDTINCFLLFEKTKSCLLENIPLLQCLLENIPLLQWYFNGILAKLPQHKYFIVRIISRLNGCIRSLDHQSGYRGFICMHYACVLQVIFFKISLLR